MKNKGLKVAVIIESVIIILVAILAVVGYALGDNKEYLLMRSTSPDETASVAIYEVGRPFLFGNSKVRIYSSGTYFEAPISNDGAALSDSNYDVTWEDNLPVITLHGEEQNDVVYRVTTKENNDGRSE